MANIPHKWAKEIKAWADGASIQSRDLEETHPIWVDIKNPFWLINEPSLEYRVKPEEPKLVTLHGSISLLGFSGEDGIQKISSPFTSMRGGLDNLRLTGYYNDDVFILTNAEVIHGRKH